jgi:two-component system response regulator PilR (NtrC family)
MQVKLLRAIQEKSIRPLGTQAEVKVDVRILSATHRNLAELVAAGKFRQDLFYRINVIQLDVPPLRERGNDIALIADFLLGRMAREGSGVKPTLTAAALQALSTYSFPGNVRELENILERAMTLSEDAVIEADSLQLPIATVTTHATAAMAETGGLNTRLSEVERQEILAALEHVRWNKTAAAKLLGISFRALRYRLEKLGLD